MKIKVSIMEALWLSDLLARVAAEAKPGSEHGQYAEALLATVRDKMGLEAV